MIRLTATPLRSVVANVALSSLTTDQSLGAIKGHNRDSAISWGVRTFERRMARGLDGVRV